MTRQEFEERTNLQVKEEDFDAIHEVYMTTDHDKDQFCDVMKQTTRNLGGFEYIRDLGIALAEQRRKSREQQDRLLAKVNELTDFIFEQSYDSDETELKKRAKFICPNSCPNSFRPMIYAGQKRLTANLKR